MRKTKLLTVLLLGLLLLLALATVAFAQGNDFDPGPPPPGADEPAVPLYSVTYADGTEIKGYVSSNMAKDFNQMPDGATMTLLDDLYLPADLLQFSISGGKHVSFDFAGHVIKCEIKAVLFTCDGADSALTVYSSAPGGAYYGKRTGDGQGSCFIKIAGGAVCYLGEKDGYSGNNLSTYCAVAVDVHGTSTANVKGGNYYRNVSDWPGLFICRSAGTINMDSANLYGIINRANFALQSSGANVTVKNSLIFNLPSISGNILFTHTNGSVINFEGCTFVNSNLTAENLNAGAEGSERALLTVDKNCIFSEAFNHQSSLVEVRIPEGTSLARVNRTYEREVVYNIFGNDAPLSYEMLTYDKPIMGNYSFAAEGETATVEWCFLDKYYSDTWIKGELPTPSVTVPANNTAIKYTVDDVSPVEDYAFYVISPELNANLFYSYTLYSSMALNVYLPASVVESGDLYSVNLSGTTYNKDQLVAKGKVTVGDEEFYVVTKKDIPYNSCASAETLTIKAVGADLNSTVASFTVLLDMAEYAETVLHSVDYTEGKDLVSSLVDYVVYSYNSFGRTPPEKLTALSTYKKED